MSPAVDTGLEHAVAAFVNEVADALDGAALTLDHIEREKIGDQVMVEAFDLSAAFIDSDELHTDSELWAFIRAFAPHFYDELAHATPADVRAAGWIKDRRGLLTEPSELFETLCEADHRCRAGYTLRYYRRAMDIAHTVGSLDDYISRTELLAIERYRTMLLRRIDEVHDDDDDSTPPVTAGLPVPEAAAVGRGVTRTPATPATATGDLGPARSVDQLFAELDALIGLDGVKQEVKLVANLLRVQQLRKSRDLPVLDTSRHLVFTGNPGTGKTTVARLLAQLYRSLGVVERGHLVETDRTGLVAGYVGQTANLVRRRFDEAEEGVLFIDEAYSLSRRSENDFGQEAIDTIVKLMEDRRDSVVLIAAGYPTEMRDFLDSNPGLRSRFPKTIHFPDYSTAELMEIFGTMEEKSRYVADQAAREKLWTLLDSQIRDVGFGNGRLIRNLFEAAVANHASRVVDIPEPSDEVLTTLTIGDIPDEVGHAFFDAGAPDDGPGQNGPTG